MDLRQLTSLSFRLKDADEDEPVVTEFKEL